MYRSDKRFGTIFSSANLPSTPGGHSSLKNKTTFRCFIAIDGVGKFGIVYSIVICIFYEESSPFSTVVQNESTRYGIMHVSININFIR